MSTLLSSEIIERYCEALRDQGVPVISHLTPGLTDEEISALVRASGLTLPEEARTWWRFSNGVPATADDINATMNGGLWWAPLADALESFDDVVSEVSDEYDDLTNLPWKPSFLPFGGGDGLFLDCAPGPVARVFWASWEDAPHGPPRLMFDTFGSLILAWTAALQAGSIQYQRERGVFVGHEDLGKYGLTAFLV